jgi:adenine-specific DNA methylase
MKIKAIHPFPARMAPDLAIDGLKELSKPGLVLDPMAGSGTVLRHASDLGHRAIGFDMDPLAVLMAQTWTTPLDSKFTQHFANNILAEVKRLDENVPLTWIDEDAETTNFTKFWFDTPQRNDLRRISYVLSQISSTNDQEIAAANMLRIALSRLIITKKRGASLAWDVSHSRPHKVADSVDYDVLPEFENSIKHVLKLLTNHAPKGNVHSQLGDARILSSISDNEVDIILTSPPYLNAIDYMRGHRLALVWLGHGLSKLRSVRSNSIGAERGPDANKVLQHNEAIQLAMGELKDLPRRHTLMVSRYAEDLRQMMNETKRVLNQDGKAIFVVGNSCLKGTFIRNSDGVAKAGELAGLELIKETERDLPAGRYLPMPKGSEDPLGKRMRTETILTFKHK